VSGPDPLPIDTVPLPHTGGEIGFSVCPGMKIPGLPAMWNRDLDADLDAVVRWGAVAVATLIEDAEMRRLTVSLLGEGVRRRGVEWYHLPIPDRRAPTAEFEAGWAEAGARLRAHLLAGRKVFVHCRGGLGRSGTVAARLLIELGETPAAALARVRAVQPAAVEVAEQEHHVLVCTPRPAEAST
jgi:ADP-ribosyl-[dinitrogen reductase] hydrolase